MISWAWKIKKLLGQAFYLLDLLLKQKCRILSMQISASAECVEHILYIAKNKEHVVVLRKI